MMPHSRRISFIDEKLAAFGRSAAGDVGQVLEAHDDLLSAGGRGKVAPLGRLPGLRRGGRRDVRRRRDRAVGADDRRGVDENARPEEQPELVLEARQRESTATSTRNQRRSFWLSLMPWTVPSRASCSVVARLILTLTVCGML